MGCPADSSSAGVDVLALRQRSGPLDFHSGRFYGKLFTSCLRDLNNGVPNSADSAVHYVQVPQIPQSRCPIPL